MWPMTACPIICGSIAGSSFSGTTALRRAWPSSRTGQAGGSMGVDAGDLDGGSNEDLL
jgi:hypothetical protein